VELSGATGRQEISDISRYRQGIQIHGLLDSIGSSSLSNEQKPVASDQMIDNTHKMDNYIRFMTRALRPGSGFYLREVAPPKEIPIPKVWLDAYLARRDWDVKSLTIEQRHQIRIAWKSSPEYLRYIASQIPFIKKEPKSYSTIKFINDLLNELQQQPETIAKYFPERMQKYSDRRLSLFLDSFKQFIAQIRGRINRGEYPNYRFKSGQLSEFREIFINKLGIRALGLIKLISMYERIDMTTLEFIDQLKKELGRVSGDIKVSYKELDALFEKSEGFISGIIKSLEGSSTKYKPDYKFNLEDLSTFEGKIALESYSLRNLLLLLKEYEKMNPDLLVYPHEQTTISNVNAFKNIFDVEASYWQGFLWADGHVSLRGDYMIQFSQTLDDRQSVEKFADFVGFDGSRIYYGPSFRKDAKGRLIRYDKAEVTFRSRIMNKRLQELGFFETKEGRKEVPNFVKLAIKLAKEEANEKSIHWSQTKNGKIAHAWLLGFFDGDGSHHSGYTAIVFASNEKMLLEIKELFESPNDVNTIRSPGEECIIFGEPTVVKGYYSLTLGSDVFKRILASYEFSMRRKRP